MYNSISQEIFEKKIGRPFFHKTVQETIPYDVQVGGMLKHVPVLKIHKIEGRTHKWDQWNFHNLLGSTDWIEIPVDHIVLHQNTSRANITLPYTVYGVPYDEVRIQYEAGVTRVPADVKQAVDTIAQLISENKIDRYNCILPSEVMKVVEKYKAKGGVR